MGSRSDSGSCTCLGHLLSRYNFLIMLKKIFTYFREKWGIETFWDFLMINIVFALAGMMIVFERKPLFEFLGIHAETALWIKILVYIPLVVPLYQLNLIIFGTLLGQFDFFWNKQKQIGRRFLKLLNR